MKNLLFILSAAFTFTATGQITFLPLGSSTNAFSCAFGAKTFLWYDKDINSLSFSHRNNFIAFPQDVTSSAIRFDVSVNGGATWTNDVGPVYADRMNTHRARFPQGVIYNPIGNTNPVNAFFHYYAPVTDATNWGENMFGTSPLTTVDSIWTRETLFSVGSLHALIPDGFQVIKNTGDVWNSSQNVVDANGSVDLTYDDGITVSKGVWNGVDDFNYTHNTFYAPVDSEMYATHSMAWSDDGMTGYVAIIGNDLLSQTGDLNYFLLIYKTADGGVTWIETPHPNINGVDSLLPDTGLIYSCAFENDAVVDVNNNLHVVVAIAPYLGQGVIGTGYGHWGIFDIYTIDAGNTWFAKLLDTPQTFRCTFGITGNATNPAVSEDNRPQASRTWDGTKLCFTWFDTDTLTYGVTTNCYPDMKSCCYDLTSGMCTNVMNMTAGTAAAGKCFQGNVSYYLIDTAGSIFIPCVVDSMDLLLTGSPVFYKYIGGAQVSAFNQVCNEVPLTNMLTGIASPAAAAASLLLVTDNYPNPFSQKTFVDVTLSKSVDVRIEISNMLGEIISLKTFSGLHAGKNILTIDGGNLAKGIYIYKVTAGGDDVVKRMCVE